MSQALQSFRFQVSRKSICYYCVSAHPDLTPHHLHCQPLSLRLVLKFPLPHTFFHPSEMCLSPTSKTSSGGACSVKVSGQAFFVAKSAIWISAASLPTLSPFPLLLEPLKSSTYLPPTTLFNEKKWELTSPENQHRAVSNAVGGETTRQSGDTNNQEGETESQGGEGSGGGGGGWARLTI